MPQTDFRFGFRIVGQCHNERCLVDAGAAFVAYSECDPEAKVDSEGYLSAFRFGADFERQWTATGTTKGYAGPTWSPWLWFDIDRDELGAATSDARRLAANLLERFAVAEDELLAFYSGAKGFHIGVPTALWSAVPSASFHAYCRGFAEKIAAAANVSIDLGVYDRVRALRAPNSRHPKTGRHKRFLTVGELMNLRPSRLVELAAKPVQFELPAMPRACTKAMCEWQAAVGAIDVEIAAVAARRASGTSPQTLNRLTTEFMRDGAKVGTRHLRLFSAAANLGEFGCSFELAWALLAESALDSGLPLSEVRRQIECGLKHRGVSR